MDGRVSYREVQSSKPAWVWGVVALVAVLGWYGFVHQILLGRPIGDNPAPAWTAWLVWLCAGIGIPLFVIAARLQVSVTETELIVRWFPLWTRRIALADIARCEPRTYRPLRDYGGWGIRYGGPARGWAYTLSGRRGLFVELRDGGHVLIGSERPERLAAALASTRAPG